MPSEESCKRELEIAIPWAEVQTETDRIVDGLRRKARVPGFRPGKVPEAVIRSRYQGDIRQEVIENLVPRHFWKEAEQQNLKSVGAPTITDVHFHDGESLHFRAEFEVFPEFELGDYRRLEVPYSEPQVSDESVAAELERLREQHVSFRNVDPRPLADGDIAVVSLESEPLPDTPRIEQEETTLTIGDDATLPDFSDNLRGKSPGDEVDFEVSYPEDFGNEKLAGKTIPFHAVVKGVRVKELPELDDAFAADVGDFPSIDELRTQVRQLLEQRLRRDATEAAKQKLVDLLAERHDFAVPEKLVEQQIATRVERTLRALSRQGVDPSKVGFDWNKVRQAERDGAIRDVKAGLLLDRIAEAEGIAVTTEEIDEQVQRYAKESQQTAAAARSKLAEDGTLDRIRSHMRNEKTLSFLFDEAQKVEQAAEEEDQKVQAE